MVYASYPRVIEQYIKNGGGTRVGSTDATQPEPEALSGLLETTESISSNWLSAGTYI